MSPPFSTGRWTSRRSACRRAPSASPGRASIRPIASSTWRSTRRTRCVRARTCTVKLTLANLPADTQAYVTLAAVDLGILNLTRYQTPDPEHYYFGRRSLGVSIRDLYNQLIDRMQGVRGTVRSGGDAGLTQFEGVPPTETLVAFHSGVVEVGAGRHGDCFGAHPRLQRHGPPDGDGLDRRRRRPCGTRRAGARPCRDRRAPAALPGAWRPVAAGARPHLGGRHRRHGRAFGQHRGGRRRRRRGACRSLDRPDAEQARAGAGADLRRKRSATTSSMSR